MSVVHGMRGVGGVGEMSIRGLGLGFSNTVGTGEVLDVCLCFGGGCVGGVGGECVGGLDQSLAGWGGVMSVVFVSLDYLCR